MTYADATSYMELGAHIRRLGLRLLTISQRPGSKDVCWRHLPGSSFDIVHSMTEAGSTAQLRRPSKPTPHVRMRRCKLPQLHASELGTANDTCQHAGSMPDLTKFKDAVERRRRTHLLAAARNITLTAAAFVCCLNAEAHFALHDVRIHVCS